MVTEVVRFLVDESPRAGTVVDATLGAEGTPKRCSGPAPSG